MRTLSLVTVLLFALSLPVWADFGEGLAAYKRGDYTTALREWYPLAEQGYAEAQHFIGFMYAMGRGVPQDDAEAAKWYRKAAEQGVAEAQFSLAAMYASILGILWDDAEAAKWYRKAAEQGHAGAQFSLGAMYASGHGVPQDDAEVLKWYRKAAEQGHAEAQFSLGLMYASGHGAPQDDAEAAKWFRKAAEQGHAGAQFSLGDMYASGRGVPQDNAEALKWYRKAPEQGNAGRQTLLGLMYASGQGVPQDYAETAKWFRKAAEQGYAEAQPLLGRMYAAGHGVPQDYVQAHLWVNLGASRLPPGEMRDKAVRLRDLLAARMPPAQLARAQEMARNWQPQTETALAPPATSSEYTAPPRRERVTPSTETVQTVQRLLTALGYDPGPADGVLGPKTRAALRAFQSRVGLSANGEVSQALVDRLTEAVARARGAPPQLSQKKLALENAGSGFVVSMSGHILTNHHVVADCREVRVRTSSSEGKTSPVVAQDSRNDLVLLRLPSALSHSATFRDGRDVRQGDGIVAVGFPLHGLLASDASVTTGTVSALAGLRNDTRFLQITAPIQSGNSGGPLLDMRGNVVGVVVSKLDALKVAQATGDIPQNVNFALKVSVIRSFLDANGVDYKTASSTQDHKAADIGESAKKFSVLIECWK